MVLPALKKGSDVDTVLTPLLSLDQVAKVKASRATPPLDVFMLDPGPAVVAIEDGLIDKFEPGRCKNIVHLQKAFYDDWGVSVAAQIVGIAYNPKKVDRPKGWKDLFEPKYNGKVGISGFGTTFGTSSLIEISKLYGGSLTNVDPAFEQLKKWLPHVAVIAQNPIAVNTLFQQGQMDVTYTNYQTVSTLKGRGVDIEFVKPETGPIAFYTTLHVVKGATNKDNAYKFIDTVLSTEVQAALQKPPYGLLSVNKNVPLQPDFPSRHRQVARRAGELRPPRLAPDQPEARGLDRALQQGGPAIAERRAAAPRAREGWLALPLACFFLLFFFAPLALLAGISLRVTPQFEGWGLVQYAKFAGDSFNWSVLGQTLLLGVKTVALTACIGVPLGLLFMEAPRRLQPILLFIIVLPLLTSVVVRTFAWIVILGREGLVNYALVNLGLVAAPLRLLHTELGLVVALSQIEMPLMLLPLISVMSRLDPNLKDASAALGAGRWRTLFRVTLPLSLPGLLAGCLLVFASSVTAFVSQTIIGGGRMVLMPFYIWQQATTLFNWPFAATISMILLVSVLAVVTTLNALGRRSRALANG